MSETDAAAAETPTPTSPRRMIPLIVLAIVLSPLVVMAIYVDDWSRDLTTNTAHTGPGQKHEPMPINGATIHDMDRAAIRFSEQQSAWSLDGSVPLPADSPLREIVGDDELEASHHFTRTTGLMRYVDDVWVVVQDSDTGVTVYAESRSRVGKGDLGQNPRNLAELKFLLFTALYELHE